jgi:signal transduction histidine kinase
MDTRTASRTGHLEPAFPAVARLELDELLTQVVERAQEVLATQGRLRGLLAATRLVASDLSLPVVLRRIVEAARDLTDARYGALGVIGPDRQLEQFLHVGFDEPTVRRIGHPPRGDGILGLLIAEPRPVRLAEISGDTHSRGFPPGHPAMHTFLGVPIQVRGEVYGNLYLAEKRDGHPFTVEDEELVTALASAAGTAIDHARLLADVHRRERWLSASADITDRILAGGPDVLVAIAREARAAAMADTAAVLVRTEPAGDLTIDAADGRGGDDIVGRRIPADSRLARAAGDGEPVRPDPAGLGFSPFGAGPHLLVPLSAGDGTADALLLTREAGSRAFTDADLDLAAAFAGHLALARRLIRARADSERLALLTDHNRIARDLHDRSVQRLFAVALGLQSLAAREPRPEPARRMATYVEDLDDTIREIRATIFELRGGATPAGPGLRSAVLGIVTDATPALGFPPHLRLSGALDAYVDDSTRAHVLAVVREGLANIARHAHASAADIEITAEGGSVTVTITDDGVGAGAGEGGGLADLRRRAEHRDGRFSIGPGPAGGTRLRWSAPTA